MVQNNCVTEYLKKAAELLVNGEIKAVTVKLYGGVSAKLSVDASENINIVRTVLETDKLQVSDQA